jgi:hypothetical protein
MRIVEPFGFDLPDADAGGGCPDDLLVVEDAGGLTGATSRAQGGLDANRLKDHKRSL